MESFCISILAVFELSESLDTNYLDETENFFSKKNDKYDYCTKQQLLEKTIQFRFKLLQKCNLKAEIKSQREKKIRCVWVLNKNVYAHRCFDISIPVNRVLQHIVT